MEHRHIQIRQRRRILLVERQMLAMLEAPPARMIGRFFVEWFAALPRLLLKKTRRAIEQRLALLFGLFSFATSSRTVFIFSISISRSWSIFFGSCP